ncbi:MAG: hypothetical protein ACRELF_09855 [Gemmataceae bacterium]
MTTATKSRQRVKSERRVHLYNADGNPKLLEMTIGKDSFSYWLKIIDADYGIGLEVRKLVTDGINPPSDDVYHVHYDPARRLSSCDCKGGTFHGHCKHQEAILALIRAGKLSVPEPKQQPSEPEEFDDPC